MKYTVEYIDGGTTYWYKEGTNIFHRENGPAVEYADGSKMWYVYGKLHREDGPAVEWAYGIKEWYDHDKRHRENGPAIEFEDGHKEWFHHGERHREDGPAIENASGRKRWYLNGRKYSKEDFLRKIEDMKKDCSNKVVKIDGKQYKLIEI